MRDYKRLFSAFLCGVALLPVVPGRAADVNGYSAKYECRAGNPICDVDVEALAQQACQQTISVGTTPTNNWSAINWNNNVICIEAGDHRARGLLLLESSGTANARKVLRYMRSGDNNDDPWNQGAPAIVRQIDTNGYDYWIFHRLTVDADDQSLPYAAFVFWDGSQHIILNRSLVQRAFATLVVLGINTGVDRISIQNSVIRTPKPAGNVLAEHQCVAVDKATNSFIVNNEIYDCNKTISMGNSSVGRNIVVENNDLYVSAAGRTNCSGSYDANGNCSVSESIISWKTGGDGANPNTILHNRFWGMRWADGRLTQGGDCPAISISADENGNSADWVAVHNNIIFDGDLSVWNYHGTGTAPTNPNNVSVVGNLIFDIRDHTPATAGEPPGGLVYRDIDFAEYYLNTVISAGFWFYTQGYGEQNDMRCNVAIGSGAHAGDIGPGVQFEHNAYYDTPPTGEANAVNKPAAMRANGAAYGLGQILRTAASANCTAAASAACFLYKVVQAGTTAGTPPAYCNSLGCTTTDGGVVVKAVRGPYEFKRRLRTIAGGESVVIPYARVHVDADEANFCPPSFANRGGVGINDDTAGSGLFAVDLKGNARSGTAGALQSEGGGGGGGQGPFPGPGPAAIPGVIEAENFDAGGEGVAYHDTDGANNGGAYRNEGVDVQPNQGDAGHDVGWTRAGEWLEYSVNVASAGSYTLEARVASDGHGGTFHVEFDGVDKTGAIVVPDTGGWQNWQTLTTTVNLSAGLQIMRVAMDSASAATGSIGNIDYLRLTALTASAPFYGTPLSVPGLIQAEDYDLGGPGVAYHDSDAGNSGQAYRADDVDISGTLDIGGGYDVGWSRAGEWRNYTVNVAAAGDYLLEVRVASNGQGGTFHIEFGGVNLTGPITVPNTGGWENWQTLTRSVSLSAGTQVMRVVLDTAAPGTNSIGDMNYVRLSRIVPISDLAYVPVNNGWGPVEKDMSNGEQAAGDGGAITLNGVGYAKGLGVHADSEVRVPLGGAYTRFISDIGIDDEMEGTAGTAQFEVWADGVMLYQSPDMNAASHTLTVNVDVAGRQELVLKVLEGSVSCCDHADWAGARLLQ